MKVAKDDLARACRAYGSMLWLLPEWNLDGPRLLWALSGCESSFGENCGQREEPFYQQLTESGTNAQLKALWLKYGAAAWSSFGPWQELLVNCAPAMRPEDFTNVNRAAMEAVIIINRRILGAEKATTLEEIAEAYNSGKWKWLALPPGVERYAADCRRYYDTVPLPAPVI